MTRTEIESFLQQHVLSGRIHSYSDSEYIRMPAKALTCNSGFVFSVQASSTHYCIPRENEPGADGYTAFEVGFPSAPIDALMPYAEDIDNPTNTVYACVPIDVIIDVIEQQNGLNLEVM